MGKNIHTKSSVTRRRSSTAKPTRVPAYPPTRLQLRFLAHARSGDKGDTANVGLIALKPEYYPILRRQVTVARVARHFKGMVSAVERFELPNLGALNFLLHGALDGGGTISLKTDAQGKVYSTALLRMKIPVDPALARQLSP
ncbi:MAG: AtuA-related protein [Gemmatimonadales bacterium]